MLDSPIRDARPGDVWLTSGSGFVNDLIAFKTWSRFTHAEVVIVDRAKNSGLETFTSRLKDGVEFYRPTLDGLALVLRPSLPFDQRKATWWAYESRSLGQPYALVGLLAFWYAAYQGRNDRAQFCSEACTRFLRAGGIDLWPGVDADTVPPSWFAASPLLTVVWRSEAEWRRWEAKGGQD